MEGAIPFQHLIEIPGLRKEDDTELQYSADTLSFLMKNGKEAEIQAVISLEAMVETVSRTELLREVEEKDYDADVWSALPSVVGLTLKPGDSLWNIAKQFHTTIARIRKLNHLETDDISERKKIIVVKEIPMR